jgi:hypothetical protein
MIRKVSLALFIFASMCFPSLNYDVALDGAETTYYGFPLPWNSRSPAASLVKDIYLIPATLDLALFAWVGFVVLRASSRLPSNKAAAITALIWLWGTLCAAYVALKFVFYSFYFQAWPHQGLFHVTAVRIGPGL